MEKITLDRDLRVIIGRNCFDVLFELVEEHNYQLKHNPGYNGNFEYQIERLAITSQVGKERATRYAVEKLECGIICPDGKKRQFIKVIRDFKHTGSNKNVYSINAANIEEATNQISKVKIAYEYGSKKNGKKRDTKTGTIKAIRRTEHNFNEK